ncbi:MarC family NAAT transporter [Halotalea alkalilenta]|uniref:MarC family NAAT transporter n=1 Tax=Halotalea alkalilenta TaxID=376489 RepID=UPI0004831522|nr:MarC family NAAT transporter [Halotalea alkalilenta]
MDDYFHYLLLGLLALLPVANPLTSVTLLLALGSELSRAERNRQILKATLYVAAILLISFYGGSAIMSAFGISIPGLRIAGGLIITYIGFTMLFPSTQPSESEAQQAMLSEEEKRKPHIRDISFVPLALPGTAGPGTIALIISAAASLDQQGGIPLVIHLVVVSNAILIALIFWIALRSANLIMKLLGESGIDAVSRVVGFLLIGMGVQFAINGVGEVVQGFGAS